MPNLLCTSWFLKVWHYWSGYRGYLGQTFLPHIQQQVVRPKNVMGQVARLLMVPRIVVAQAVHPVNIIFEE